MLKRLTQSGDTILEVLVAIAVVSTVLAAAYVSANRSSQSSLQSQERSQATRLAESQAEQIKVLARDPAQGIFASPNVFCIAYSGANQDKKQTGFSGDGPFAGSVTLENDDFSSYPPGGVCRTGYYNVAVKYQPPSSPTALDDFFTILVRWNRVGGGIQSDEVKMVYRLH